MGKFRGYELLNPSMVLPAVVCVASHYSASALSSGGRLDRNPEEKRPLTACMEWLIAQGVLKGHPSAVEASSSSAQKFFENIETIGEVVAAYGELAEFTEHLIGIRNSSPVGLCQRLMAGLSDTRTASYWIDALLPAALTFLHECPTRTDPSVNMSKALIRDGEADLSRLLPETIDGDAIRPMLTVLTALELLEDMGGQKVRLTDKGSTLMKLSGYAELILSYYPAYCRLPELSQGLVEYGFGKDVSRAIELNVRASNGIINLRVAPAIVGLFESNPLVRQALTNHGGIAIDFGAGGGEMVQAFLNSPLVEQAYGLDVDPGAVEEARLLAHKRGIPKSNIRFLVGSIGDRAPFEAFKSGLVDGATPVGTINFILHDVEPQLARDFLRHYREVLTGSPLIITESFRVPLEAMVDHPNYQASSFKFMHDVSGQHLFYKDEFENLLQEMGFQIIEEVSHSSMFWEKEDQKLPTITTYVFHSS
jgi:hypothetical protein